MKEYIVVLKTGEQIVVDADTVSQTETMTRFIKKRGSVSDLYLHGPDVVAAFNVDEVKYYTVNK